MKKLLVSVVEDDSRSRPEVWRKLARAAESDSKSLTKAGPNRLEGPVLATDQQNSSRRDRTNALSFRGAHIRRGEIDSMPVEAWSPLLNEGTETLLVVARLRSPNHILRLVI